MDSSEIKTAREVAIKHIGIATYSSGSIYEYLLRKNFSDEAARAVVDELIERKYIDDVKASRKILLSRTGKKQESKDLLLKRLIEGGVDRFVAEDYIYELPSDSDTILSLFEAHTDDSSDVHSDEFRNNLASIASKRGYSYECFNSAYKIFVSNK